MVFWQSYWSMSLTARIIWSISSLLTDLEIFLEKKNKNNFSTIITSTTFNEAWQQIYIAEYTQVYCLSHYMAISSSSVQQSPRLNLDVKICYNTAVLDTDPGNHDFQVQELALHWFPLHCNVFVVIPWQDKNILNYLTYFISAVTHTDHVIVLLLVNKKFLGKRWVNWMSFAILSEM